MVADSMSVSASSYDKPTNKNIESMMSCLLKRMNPAYCLCSQAVDEYDFEFSHLDELKEDAEFDKIMEGLIKDMDLDAKDSKSRISRSGHGHNDSDRLNAKISALDTLYQFSGMKSKRISIVCTSKWDVIGLLIKCLRIDEIQASKSVGILQYEQHQKIRQLACLTLNNLSIPKENKSIMILGCHATALLENLTRIIRMQESETSYLCCICLMNLSFLTDGVEPIITFSPQSDRDANQGMNLSTIGKNNIDSKDWENFPTSMLRPSRAPTPPRQRRSRSNTPTPFLDNPNSLLLSIESLMRDHQPFLMSKTYSVEGEAVRWSVGLLRNLTKRNSHCSIISKTEIPMVLLRILEKSPNKTTEWTKDSVEDMTLTVFEQLAGSPDGRQNLKLIGLLSVIQRIECIDDTSQRAKRKVSSIIRLLER